MTLRMPPTEALSLYTGSAAFLEALVEAGVDYVFANFGSDHPALIECLAEAKAKGIRMPRLITCPNEMVALSAAHGHALVSGRAQAVVVHVECGTQALAGAVHNAAKGRVPVLIYAGASPFTQEGELKGSRNEFIQWIQDVPDQRGLVRGYMKYDNEFRTPANVKQLTHRALQFAHSDPRGPVYLMGAREVMEAATERVAIDPADWAPLGPAALPPAGLDELVDDLVRAKRPLIVTSYLGRKSHAVERLVALADRFAIAILESVPSALNFPHDHPMYQGQQWNEPRQNPVLAAADVVLVVDSDVPWIPTVSRPARNAVIYHLDVDALKQQMPLWYIHARRSYQVDTALALQQIADRLEARSLSQPVVAERRALYASWHEARDRELTRLEQAPEDGVLTGEFVTATVRRYVDDDTIVLNEGITNYPVINNHLRPTRPGSLFASGGGSLGWHGGAAIGAKLAAPDKTVIAMTGDGSYMFSVPSSVHWMARHYETPFLTIVFNNRGWKAPKFSTLAVHPDGFAARANDLGTSFDPPPDYAGIAAAAGGAFARTVKTAAQLEAALPEAIHVVKHERRAAVLDVWLARL